MTTGALDYLVTAPSTPSGIGTARDQGAADRKQCTAVFNSECGDLKGMSMEELNKQGECAARNMFKTPACVGTQRCTLFEANLPSGSD